MARVTINGEEIELDDAARLNGIEAARLAGVDVPHYCWHPGLSVVASCRMCLVESGRKDAETGEISMIPKLVPACQTPATDGSVFVTDSDKVRDARAMVEEDLLLRHPVDCPICDKAGECSLQDYHFQHGREQRRADIKPFTSRRRPVGDTVTLFVDRCVMCTRCVRFTHEITGTHELMVTNRGAHEEIDVFPGFPLDNKMSGNVVDLCPVGALGDVDFLYSQRVWFMKSHSSVCAGCATGCSIQVEENQERVYRLKPRENPHVNQWWMCDDGRYGFKYIHDAARLVQPRMRDGEGPRDVDWDEALQQAGKLLADSQELIVVLSPFLTVEEAYCLARFAQSLEVPTQFVVGAIPRDGEDTTFPGGFTIRAEKCPNRRGVEAVATHFQQQLIEWDTFLENVPASATIWLTGSYPQPCTTAEQAEALAEGRTLIVQDLFASPLTEHATLLLPSAAWVERSGTFVNAADHVQSFEWAIRPPQGVMSEGQVFWRLASRTGLYDAAQLRIEAAQQISYFAPLADPVPEQGFNLKVNQLANV